MLDPFPFGGGGTSLVARGLCTPIVTWPQRQTTLRFTAGIEREGTGERDTTERECERARARLHMWERAERERVCGRGYERASVHMREWEG
jgi:hypothetical protein